MRNDSEMGAMKEQYLMIKYFIMAGVSDFEHMPVCQEENL